VLVRQFAVAEFDDHDQRDLDVFTRGRNTGQHPRHLLRMGEGKNDLVDELIFAHSARNRSDLGVGRHRGDEIG